MKPLILDLFCGEGGASKGYHDAGFDVIGVDIVDQPRYPFQFMQHEAIDLLGVLAGGGKMITRQGRTYRLSDFDAIHASPPCQAYSKTQQINGNEHPDLITSVRALLKATGLPYVIENVPGAPLREPETLCGAMFGIETYRHREFETSWIIDVPAHPMHVAKTTKMGRPPVEGEYMHIVGNFSGVDRAREIMGMPWASRDGLREAIPPAYARHIGLNLMALLVRKIAV